MTSCNRSRRSSNTREELPYVNQARPPVHQPRSCVVYPCKLARAVLSKPRRRISGSAQWCPARTAMPCRAQDRGGVVSFTLDGPNGERLATLLDRQGIAVRAGHHCAEPLMRRLGLDSTARASFGVYTTHDEIDDWRTRWFTSGSSSRDVRRPA